MINQVKRKQSDDSKTTQILQWFHSYITKLNETILKKLLTFWTGFNDPASLDEQFVSLDFSPDEILPRASTCTFNLFLILKCAKKEEFKQMTFDGYLEVYTVKIYLHYLGQTH